MLKCKLIALLSLTALLLTGVFFTAFGTACAADASLSFFEPLKARLAADGFSPDRIARLYGDSRAAFDTRSVSLFFVHSEARLNYDQFTTTESVDRARAYLQAHEKALAQAEQTYGVGPEVITAIILVETQLGTMTGGSNVFNALSTMAALTDSGAREALWKAIPKDRRFSRKEFDKKANKKSRWAYDELKALIRYTARENMDPGAIAGSYAGAMGISQFMPSNALRLAIDGNDDGRIDLFVHEDAIASVANYLRHHGWSAGIGSKKAYRVILRYNYSSYYAKTILKIAKKLKSG
ncbi:MAG: lytic murein transglycosylase [Desulfobacterales bacterium]|nr:lytic murein transglycosylase [Desulfobacterales bacterium]